MMVPPVVETSSSLGGNGIPTELSVPGPGLEGNMATHYGEGGGGAAFPIYTQEEVHHLLPPQAPHGGAPPPSAYHRTQQQQQAVATNTPWKLGSTDGMFAMNLALYKQQQAGLSHNAAAASNGRAAARLSPLLEDAGGGGLPSSSSHASQTNPATAATGGGVKIGGTAAADDRTPVGFTHPEAAALVLAVQGHQSVYQDLLFRQPSGAVEAVLAAACEAMAFDISEMWLRTGPKTHQLTNSHLRPTALEDSVRRDLVDVYYGDKSSERTHRLSPALCKRAKEANDVVWVTGHTPYGADALRASISNVRTAVAVPVCHEASNTNITIIFFSIRR
jgi:hypothetical protein